MTKTRIDSLVSTLTEQAIAAANDEVGLVQASMLEKLKSWLTDDQYNPYAVTKFDVTARAAELQEKYKDLPDGEKTEDTVSVAGRIMAIRNDGMFIVLQDPSASIQIFHYLKELPDDTKARLKRLDLGDIIGVTGIVRRTPRGELTINGSEFMLLTKCLDPLPEKYHGMTDPETRVRERHKDISANEDVRKRLLARSRIIHAIRDVFDERGFIEVDTPSLHPIAGGAEAKPFVTHHNTLDMELFLRIAPELYLKRLIISGLAERVYEIGKNFRNEGISPKHNPEFTMVECYQAYADYADMIDLLEDIVTKAVARTSPDGGLKVSFGDKEIDFTAPWPRKTMAALVHEKTGIDFLAFEDAASAIKAARGLGLDIADDLNWGQVLAEVFEEKVEDTLIQPIHVVGIPTDISPLAKPSPDNPRVADRFESFVNGWEIANAFSELNDPFIQSENFAEQMRRRAAGDEEAALPDESYVLALEYGLPPTGGMGIGVDRLTMLLTNAQHIREVIAFPTVRPDNNPKKSVSSVVLSKSSTKKEG